MSPTGDLGANAESRSEGRLAGGSVTAVHRVGATVRRATGPWTPAVHALLEHLAERGFPAAPRVLGIDEQGREVLSYLEGAVATRPWPEVLRTGDGLVQVGRTLRAYHDAVADFRPPPGAVWRTPGAPATGEVIRHGDLGPWNSVWRGGRLVGFIDWDFAEPGSRLQDVAQAAWYFVPLRPDENCRKVGFASPPNRAERLCVLCNAYGGFTSAEVVGELERLITIEATERTQRLGRRGLEPWATFLRRGDLEEFAREAAWLRNHEERLVR
jgi:Ser/Thr protein kinase RdoA (MazF antagonist)